jgi:hypothetical protein
VPLGGAVAVPEPRGARRGRLGRTSDAMPPLPRRRLRPTSRAGREAAPGASPADIAARRRAGGRYAAAGRSGGRGCAPATCGRRRVGSRYRARRRAWAVRPTCSGVARAPRRAGGPADLPAAGARRRAAPADLAAAGRAATAGASPARRSAAAAAGAAPADVAAAGVCRPRFAAAGAVRLADLAAAGRAAAAGAARPTSPRLRHRRLAGGAALRGDSGRPGCAGGELRGMRRRSSIPRRSGCGRGRWAPVPDAVYANLAAAPAPASTCS